jgi:hypothetical protein
VQDGNETDIDCGGGTCPACASGMHCSVPTDCVSGICQGVAPNRLCGGSSCTDGVQNGNETDIDCGGTCPKCGDGKQCRAAVDCVSASCVGNVCQPISCSDGVQNGDETDIDCGGACPSKCARNKVCAVASDCLSGVCKTNSRCQ